MPGSHADNTAIMALSIFVGAYLDEAARALLRRSLTSDHVCFGDPLKRNEADRSAFLEAEVVFGNVPAAWLKDASRLRWMQLESIGFEYYQHLDGKLDGFKISNLRGMFDRPAAETAFAGLLSLGRGLLPLLKAQEKSQWVELEVRPDTWLLHGRRVVVLGLGSIGRKMKSLLEAFSCEVKTFAKTNPQADLHSIQELKTAFSQADIVVSCLPKTPQTIRLISRDLLECLSAHAVFVSIGRGAVVDEDALVELLNQRRFRGAVIDVTHAEPLPSDHPLWRCPNTILTQHTGGGYGEELIDKARVFLGNLECYRRGEPPGNLVDLKRGY